MVHQIPQRRILKIGVKIPPPLGSPDIQHCGLEYPERRCKKPGYEIELIDIIMRLLGWDYQLVPADAYGYFDVLTGEWTGLLGSFLVMYASM